MAWRRLNLRDVAAHLSQEEMDAFRQYGDFDSGEDPILDLCSQVAALCRMKMRKNFYIRLSPDRDALPPELISPACDIVAFKVLKRLQMEMTESRRIGYQDAMRLLDAVQSDDSRPESWTEDGAESEDLRNTPFLAVNIRPDILR